MKSFQFAWMASLLVFARGCDFYSTSLWFFDDPSGETNPLYRWLGIGWEGLIVVNVMVVALVLLAFYQHLFRKQLPELQKMPGNMMEFIAVLYFQDAGKFYQVFYKSPMKNKVYIGHLGYVLFHTIVVASFLATVHNLCQYYQIPAYAEFREWVGRPLYFIYGLIILSMVFFSLRVWLLDYQKIKETFDSDGTVKDQ